jgi:penicillin-binding protein 1A
VSPASDSSGQGGGRGGTGRSSGGSRGGGSGSRGGGSGKAGGAQRASGQGARRTSAQPRRPGRRGPKSKPRRSLPLRLLKWLAVLALVGAVAGVVGVAGIFWYYGRDLPDLRSIDDYRPKQVSRVYAAGGELIDLWTDEDLIYRTVLPFEEIPQVMREAVLAAEDADFYSHRGVDFPGVMRAIWSNVRHGSMRQGFSSITQQVVKNLILSPERALRRKVQEVILAVRLEDHLGKDEILSLYLNEVYFGGNRYGVEEAAQYYFGHSVREVTLPEAALLAGLLPSPARYNPFEHPDRALERREYVLGQMWQKGFIEESAYRTAMEAPLELARNAYPDRGAAPHFVQAVRRQLVAQLGEEVVTTGGLVIETTVDLAHQRAAEAALREALEAYDERHDVYDPVRRLGDDDAIATFRRRFDASDGLDEGDAVEAVVLEVIDDTLRLGLGELEVSLAPVPLRRITRGEPLASRYERGDVLALVAGARVTGEALRGDPGAAALRLVAGPEAAFVAIDPSNRHVLALVGAYDFRASHFDRATQARRQTGSAFKPFIYAAALARGLVTPASLVHDEPTPFRLPGGRSWNPQNSDGEYLGRIPLRTALARSRNVVSVRLLNEVGVPFAEEIARAAGIETPLVDNLTAALGSTEIPVLELVNAYATLAAGGLVAEPILVTRVTDSAGNVLIDNQYEPRRGLDPALAYVVTDLMTSVVERGTATDARALGRPAAGKTGTTNEARDAWFVGFVPQLVAGGWVGYDDLTPLGRREYGGRAALPMWLGYMQEALEGVPVRDFGPPPAGVVVRRVDPSTGLLAAPDARDGVDELFVEGTEPMRYAPEAPQQPRLDDF